MTQVFTEHEHELMALVEGKRLAILKELTVNRKLKDADNEDISTMLKVAKDIDQAVLNRAKVRIANTNADEQSTSNQLLAELLRSLPYSSDNATAPVNNDRQLEMPDAVSDALPEPVEGEMEQVEELAAIDDDEND